MYLRKFILFVCTILFLVSHSTTLNKHRRTINDFSNLNKTKIHTIATPTTYEEIKKLIQYASENGLSISMAGKRHSQGGHTFCPNALVLDIKKLNKILHLDKEKKIVTVQTGVTWRQLQDYLNKHNLAVKVMQVANIFTIGGALSVNANGIDPHCGPLIETVKSIKILLSNGNIVHASRTENKELFTLALGGYGLFGVILEANLEVVDNELYERNSEIVSLKDYPTLIKKISHNPEIGFHFAYVRMCSPRQGLFSDALSITYNKMNAERIKQLSPKQKNKAYKLTDTGSVPLKRMATSLVRDTQWARNAHFLHESHQNGLIVSRNNIMRLPVEHVYSISHFFRHLLQEYFIPVDSIGQFLEQVKKYTLDENVNLVHAALRYIPANNEASLSYARKDCIGVVLLISERKTVSGNKKTERWTRAVIDSAVALGGTYYLVIPLFATADQLYKAYPTIKDFFSYKKQYDPQELLCNCFYQKYSVLN